MIIKKYTFIFVKLISDNLLKRKYITRFCSTSSFPVAEGDEKFHKSPLEIGTLPCEIH